MCHDGLWAGRHTGSTGAGHIIFACSRPGATGGPSVWSTLPPVGAGPGDPRRAGLAQQLQLGQRFFSVPVPIAPPADPSSPSVKSPLGWFADGYLSQGFVPLSLFLLYLGAGAWLLLFALALTSVWSLRLQPLSVQAEGSSALAGRRGVGPGIGWAGYSWTHPGFR